MARTTDVYELRVQTDQAQRALNGIKTALGAVAGAFAIRELAQFGSQIAQTTVEFEKYRTTLQTFLGSQQAANAAMDQLKNLATDLPQDIDDITNAFVILSRQGLAGTDEEIRNIANIAAGSGRSMSQFAEAVADAMTGEFERLKEFGIKVGREGETMIARIGEETVAVADNATDLTNTLIQLGNTKFAGAAEAQMDTLGGALSQFRDSVTNSQVALGEGLRPALIEVISQVTNFIRSNEDAARSLGENLGAALLNLRDITLVVADNIELVGAAFAALAAAKVVGMLVAAKAAMVGLAAAAATISAPVAAIAAAVAGLVIAWQRLSGEVVEVSGVTTTWGEVVFALFDRLTQIVKVFAGWIGDQLVSDFNAAGDAAGGAVDYIIASFNNLAEAVKVPINLMIGYANAMFQQWTTGITDIPKMFVAALEAAATIIRTFVSRGAEQFGELFDYITSFGDDEIQNVFDGFGDKVVGEISKIGDASSIEWDEILGRDYLGDAAGSVIQTANDLQQNLVDNVGDIVTAYQAKTAATDEDTDSQEDNNESTRTANQLAERNLALKNLQQGVEKTLAESRERVNKSLEQQELSRYAGIQRELKSIELEEKRIADQAKQRLREQFGDDLSAEDLNRQLRAIDDAAAKTIRSRQEAARAIKVNSEAVEEQQKRQEEAIEKSQQTFANGWRDAFEEYQDNASNAAATAERLFTQATQGMEDAIVGFVKTGKFEFKDLIADMLETLLRSQIQQMMGNLMGGGNPLAGGSVIGSGIDALFGGFFATGGQIPAGRFGVVGENGPELVSGPANVEPNIGGGNVTYNINAVDAASFKQLVARDPGFIHAVSEQGRKKSPQTRR